MKQNIIEAIKIHKELLVKFEKTGLEVVAKASEMIIACFKGGGKIYLCGNGGSAADCQHISGELVGKFRRQRKGLPAIALSTDTSILTSVGNDCGFEDIFTRQVEAHVTAKDILWALSTSGSSPNILAAVQLAQSKGAKILAFTGRTDTPLERMSDLCLSIDAPTSAAAQEIHQLAYHIICDIVEEQMC
ncbi:MAG: SIS domain-containing protein [Phycisphaerae bacterium]